MSKYGKAIAKLETSVITCLCCQGKKTQEVTVDERFNPVKDRDNPSGISKFSMPCFWCRGTGVMNKDQQWAYDYEKNMWCKCGKGTKSGGSYYVPDNKHRVVRKHHWRCNHCDKVTQVG